MIKAFISGLFTLLIIGVVGAPIPVAIATLASYIASRFLVDEAFAKVKAKEMPEWMEWTAYALCLVGSILLAAGLRYMSVVVLILSGVAYVAAAVFYMVHKRLKDAAQ